MHTSPITVASAIVALAPEAPIGVAMKKVYDALMLRGGPNYVVASLAVTEAAATLTWKTELGLRDLVGSIAHDIAKKRTQAMRWEVVDQDGTILVNGQDIGQVSYYRKGDARISGIICELYDALQCHPVAWANGDVFVLNGEEIAEMIEGIHIVPAHGIADRMRLVEAD